MKMDEAVRLARAEEEEVRARWTEYRDGRDEWDGARWNVAVPATGPRPVQPLESAAGALAVGPDGDYVKKRQVLAWNPWLRGKDPRFPDFVDDLLIEMNERISRVLVADAEAPVNGG